MRGDHHGDDWEGPAVALPPAEVGTGDCAADEFVAQYDSEVAEGAGGGGAEVSARVAATTLTPEQFKLVTKNDTYPDYLKKDVKGKNLEVYANGQIDYTLRGVHARASVIWNFQAPQGTGDTHYSIMKGSKANLIIRQGKEQNFKPVLYIESLSNTPAYEKAVAEAFKKVQATYPGIELKKNDKGWEVVIPKKYDIGHEAHFSQVAKKYMDFLKAGKLPEWEVPNMISKYYTTTQALKMAQSKK